MILQTGLEIGAFEVITGLIACIVALLMWISTRQISALDKVKERVVDLETWKATERAKEEEREKTNSQSVGKLMNELSEALEKLEQKV